MKPGLKMHDIEKAFEEEVERLQNRKIDERELEKIKNQLKSEFVTKLERVYHKAEYLCFYTMFFSDPHLLYKELDRFMEITPANIQQAAQTYLTRENRSVIEVYPHSN